MDFFLDDLSIDVSGVYYGVLSISFFMSINIYFMYLDATELHSYMLTTVQ